MRVPFSDVDMHGNVHNSRYAVYAENAVNDFLAERGLAERTRPGVGDLIFLVKELSVEYRRPLRFGDTVACRVRDVRVAGPRLTFDVTVLREPEGDGEPAVAAKITITWVRVSPDRTALRVPPDVADSLRVDA